MQKYDVPGAVASLQVFVQDWWGRWKCHGYEAPNSQCESGGCTREGSKAASDLGISSGSE